MSTTASIPFNKLNGVQLHLTVSDVAHIIPTLQMLAQLSRSYENEIYADITVSMPLDQAKVDILGAKIKKEIARVQAFDASVQEPPKS